MMALTTEEYGRFTLADYYAIPDNIDEGLADVKVCHITQGLAPAADFVCDISVLCDRKTGQCHIDAIGDLHHQHGFAEINGQHLCIAPLKGHAVTRATTLTQLDYLALLKQGINYFYGNTGLLDNQSGWPVWYTSEPMHEPRNLMPDDPACLILNNDQNTPVQALLGNQLISLTQ